jgi:hypothetical protein
MSNNLLYLFAFFCFWRICRQIVGVCQRIVGALSARGAGVKVSLAAGFGDCRQCSHLFSSVK